MAFIIAMAGKGGTGKTTIAAMIVRSLVSGKRGSVLAVDADPNSNLGEVLGLEQGATIGSVLDEISADPDKVPAGMSKDRYIEYKVQTAVVEGDGVDLISMGKPEGPGCYCYANNVLRGVVERLIRDYEYVVIDNEAGLEHLSRRTTRSADILLVIAQDNPVALKAAGRIASLADELKIRIGKKFLLVNSVSEGFKPEKTEVLALEYAGCVAYDPGLAGLSSSGGPVWDLPGTSPAYGAVEAFVEKIEKIKRS